MDSVALVSNMNDIYGRLSKDSFIPVEDNIVLYIM